ncbi:MAG: hypothetical protein JWR83_2324, partial [Aeromicrobium sp.]|nr:hypothetical protein [Aeromicrobium sp.]
MMGLCWACVKGLPPVAVPASVLPLPPLGTCWECHVSTCGAHARRDPGPGKWLCYSCVASVLAVSAGLDTDHPTSQRFDGSLEFEDRFSELA